MAAIFTLRKGTSNYSTIADAELYLHQGSGSIQFGSGSGNAVTLLPLNVPANGNIRLTGDITASSAYFSGDVAISGNLFLGNASNDTITAGGEFTSNLIPNPTNTYALGSSTKLWKEVHATSISGAIAATNGVISGSAQIPSLLPSGIVSGSSQIVLRSTDGFSAYDSAISTITGSLIASASTAKTANDLQDVNIINLNLTTASLNTSVSNLNLTTASLNTSVSNLNTATANINLTTASLNTSVLNLNTTTASLNTSVLNLELFSSSQLNKDSHLATYTGSVNTRLTEIGVVSGSLIVSASSFEIRSATLATYTASVNTRLTEIGVVSGSLIASASAVSTSVWYLNQTSQSLEIRNTTLASVTSSYDTRWSTLASYTGSNDTTNTNQNSRLTALEVSSASVHDYTASLKTALDVSGQNLTVYGNLTVQGTQTTLNTNEVIVEDKTLTLASGSTTSAEADGAGVQIAGANVTMSWDNSNTRVLFNTNLGIIGSISSSTLVGLNGASVASYSSSVTNRLTNLESKSGSVDIRLTEIGVVSGSLINSASSFETRFGAVATISGSLISTASNHENRVVVLESTASYLQGTFSTSVDSRLDNLEAASSSFSLSILNLNGFSSSQLTQNSNLATHTGSVNTRLTEIGVVTGSLIISASNAKTTNDAQDISISKLNDATASLFISSSTLTASFTALRSEFNTLTASVDPGNVSSQFSNISTRFTTLATLTGSYDNRFTEIGVVTGSLILSASTAKTTNDTQDGRLNNLESKSGSVDTRLTEIGVVSGSLISSASAASIANANQNLFTQSAETRFTEIGVVSGSLISSASAANVSITNINLTTASLNTSVTNLNTASSSYETKGRGIVSGSSQITYASISSIPAGIVSGSSQLSGTTITDLTIINLTTVNQTASVVFSSGSNKFGDELIDVQQFTGSVQVTGSLTTIGTVTATSFNGVINATNGVVSGSSQITLQSTTGFTAYDTALSTITGSLITSASAAKTTNDSQGVSITNLNTTSASVNTSITNLEAATSSYETNGRGIVSGSSQILGGSGIVSGSSQITYASISSIPSGIVSGAAQIPALLPSGVVSGSSQVLGGSGIVSGSSQITYASISSIPSGIVSGSSQVIGILDSLNTFSGSANTRFTEIGVVSGSLISSASAAKTTNDSQGVSITNLNLTTASLNTSVSNLNTATSSYETKGRSIVSSSAQIVPLLPAGVVSGSSQVITSNAITLGTHTTGNYIQTITGTANQITVAGSGLESADVTLSTPQNIHTSAHVQFHCIGLGTAASGVAGEVRATGDITAFYSSDIRLKENIVPIENALSKVESISGNTYDWKEGYEEIHSHKGNDVGVIAQEIEEILPQIVTNRDNGYKAVQYEKIVPLLIEAIKELSAKVKELENK